VRILRRAPVKEKPGASRLGKGQPSRIFKWRGRWRKRMSRLKVIWYVTLHLFKPTHSRVSQTYSLGRTGS